MKLHHFPSPNPQKVTFALRELGLDCEIVPVDLAKGEQRQPEFLALIRSDACRCSWMAISCCRRRKRSSDIWVKKPAGCSPNRGPIGRRRSNGSSSYPSTLCRPQAKWHFGSARKYSELRPMKPQSPAGKGRFPTQ